MARTIKCITVTANCDSCSRQSDCLTPTDQAAAQLCKDCAPPDWQPDFAAEAASSEPTGLILAHSDIESGNWDLTVSIDFKTATIQDPEPRHQSQRASQSVSSYHDRALDIHVSGLLTWEEFRAWKEEYQEYVDELCELYSQEFRNGNTQGVFEDEERARDLKDILNQSLQDSVKTEYADYSELDSQTASEICEQFNVTKRVIKLVYNAVSTSNLVTDLDVQIRDLIDEIAAEIVADAESNCIIGHADCMILSYLERSSEVE